MACLRSANEVMAAFDRPFGHRVSQSVLSYVVEYPGVAAETTAVARDLGVTEHDVTEMERRLSSRDVSYDPTPDADDEDSSSYSPSAYLPAPDSDPAVAIENAEWDDDVGERVSQAMTQLDERSRAILRARWMEEPKATLHDLADKYGVSAERIRQT